MSTYCAGCRYDPDGMTEENACPFNALYWDFLVRHEETFRANQRMPFVYATWDRFAEDKQKAIRAKARQTLRHMREGTL